MPIIAAVLVLTMTFLIVGAIGAIIYLIINPMMKKLVKKGKLSYGTYKKIDRYFVYALLLISIYLTYDAFFPGRSFYANEFKSVTLRHLPKSAKFVSKSASYPDFHGDYCSSSQIRLSKSDYQRLLHELENDNRITKNADMVYSQEFHETMGDNSSKNIIRIFSRRIEGEGDHDNSIGFCDDGTTIFVSICVV